MKPINIDILSPIHIKDILQESGLILTENLSLIQKSFLHLLTIYILNKTWEGVHKNRFRCNVIYGWSLSNMINLFYVTLVSHSKYTN